MHDPSSPITRIRTRLTLGIAASLLFLFVPMFFGVDFGPLYVGLASPSFVFLVFSLLVFLHLKETQRRTLLRKGWGFPVARKRDDQEIGFHFRMTRDEKPEQDILDDRTWSDLDMDFIFSQVDRTLTVPGEQILFTILHRPLLSSRGLEERNRWISFFLLNRDSREKAQSILSKLGRLGGEDTAELLWGDLPDPIPWAPLMIAVPALVPVFILLLFTHHPWAWFGLGTLFVTEMIIHFLVKRKASNHFASIRYLGRLIAGASKLARLDLAETKISGDETGRALKTVLPLAKKTMLLTPEGINPLYDYLNILFLLEARAFNDIVKSVGRNRRQLQDIFEWTGFVDAMSSIASFRAGAGTFCEPRFTDSGPLAVLDGAVHPLVDNPVPNSFVLNAGGFLITGSNMSGKTTFMKTIGLIAVMAQTICTCPANKYEARFFRVATLIGRKDNIIEGKSYYLDEIQALLRLLTPDHDPRPRLILLDELFRGTNSKERIAASIEVLLYLRREIFGCTLASTHDLEVSVGLGSDFVNYHFQEKIGASGIVFDYKLEDGPSQTRNAIELLHHVGFPREIVEAARKRTSPKG